MEQSDLGREGIRGWLFLFCLLVTVVGPLLTWGGLANLYYKLRPSFDIDDGLRGAFAVYAITICGLTIFGVYAGFRMWRKDVVGLKLAKLFIVGAVAFAWISSFIWIVGVKSVEFSKVMGSFLGSAVGVTVIWLVWYAYLNKSKRVRAVYLSNSTGSANKDDITTREFLRRPIVSFFCGLFAGACLFSGFTIVLTSTAQKWEWERIHRAEAQVKEKQAAIRLICAEANRGGVYDLCSVVLPESAKALEQTQFEAGCVVSPDGREDPPGCLTRRR